MPSVLRSPIMTDDGNPEQPHASEPRDPLDETTRYVRGAARGDRASLDWLVARFTPLLLAQADLLMGRKFRSVIDPEDLVSEVWAVALPRLAGLSERGGRRTPAFMKFLATTLRYRFSNILQKHQGKPRKKTSSTGSSSMDPVRSLEADTTGVISRVVRHEFRAEVARVLGELSDDVRAIIVLRGFEQLTNQEVGEELGLLPNTVAVKYRRALAQLRERLPDSLFAEFTDDV